MSVQALEAEISNSDEIFRGVKVSYDLWNDLKGQGKIEEMDFCPIGFPDLKIKFPVIKGTKIVVWLTPELSNKNYTLPIDNF